MTMTTTHNDKPVPMPQAGMTVTQSADGTRAIAVTGDRSQTALEASAKARILAKYSIAQQSPRSWDHVSVRLLRECARPRFAEVARYELPRGGKKIAGPSIRFAEAVLRYAGNIDVQTTTTYEDDTRRTLHVAITDLETNYEIGTDITIEKTIERKDGHNRRVIATRTNSQEQTVYICEATEDELLQKSGALVSKAIRTNGLRLVPGDVIEDCMAAVMHTLSGNGQDPTVTKKRCIDGFVSVGVTPKMLEDYITAEFAATLDAPSPGMFAHLSAVLQSIREGEVTWKEIAAKAGSGEPSKKASPAEQIKAKAAAAKGERQPGEEG